MIDRKPIFMRHQSQETGVNLCTQKKISTFQNLTNVRLANESVFLTKVFNSEKLLNTAMYVLCRFYHIWWRRVPIQRYMGVYSLGFHGVLTAKKSQFLLNLS